VALTPGTKRLERKTNYSPHLLPRLRVHGAKPPLHHTSQPRILRPDEGYKVLRNVGILLHHYTASQPRGTQLMKIVTVATESGLVPKRVQLESILTQATQSEVNFVRTGSRNETYGTWNLSLLTGEVGKHGGWDAGRYPVVPRTVLALKGGLPQQLVNSNLTTTCQHNGVVWESQSLSLYTDGSTHSFQNALFIIALLITYKLKIIIKWILGKQSGKMWTGCIWFRVGTSGRLLWP